MRQPLTKEEALSRAEALCSRSEHSTGDIQHKLYQWGVERADADAIIDHLLDERYIDNRRFARAYTLDKMRYNAWGRIKIAQGLRAAGVSSADVDAAFAEISHDEYAEILRTVVDRKRKQLPDTDEYTLRGKLIRHALSHGFEMELVLRLVGED